MGSGYVRTVWRCVCGRAFDAYLHLKELVLPPGCAKRMLTSDAEAAYCAGFVGFDGVVTCDECEWKEATA